MSRTNTTTRTEEAQAESLRLSPQEYGAFIGQIELRSIWLKHAKVANLHGSQTPRQAIFHINSHADWETIGGGFRVMHVYEVRAEAKDGVLANLEVAFAVDFDSEQPMTDEIFEIFEDVNLPVNTWPFLREFVLTTTGRMGWMPFTLPVLKKGVTGRRRSAAAERGGATRSRRQPREPEPEPDR